MSDLNAAPAADAAPGPIDYQPPALSQDEISLDDAVRLWNEPPKKKTEAESAEPAKNAEAATAENELPDEGNAESSEKETAATENEEIEPEVPAVEMPQSWKKDASERWTKLDRETQQFLAEADKRDQAAIKRAFNEAAEQRKAFEAKASEVDKVKQQYESQLPALMKELESVNQAQFGDIKSMEDVVKLQSEDPFRFQAWQVHQMRLQAVKQESDRAEQQRAQTRQSNRVSYETEQNKLLIDLVPEMADPKKSVELRERAVTMLTDDLGMKRDQLERWMADDTGHEILSNAGFQKLVADGLKYRDLLSAPKAVSTKALPPVLRPGTRAPAGAAAAQDLKTLNQKLNVTGSVDDAMALLMAQRKAS